jgi:hypothetical protein
VSIKLQIWLRFNFFYLKMRPQLTSFIDLFLGFQVLLFKQLARRRALRPLYVIRVFDLELTSNLLKKNVIDEEYLGNSRIAGNELGIVFWKPND